MIIYLRLASENEMRRLGCQEMYGSSHLLIQEWTKPGIWSIRLNEPERFRSREYLDVLDAEEATERAFFAAGVMERIRDAGAAGYPKEVCGLLIGYMDRDGWHIQDMRPVANLNAERAHDRFALDPQMYQVIDRELRGSGLEIIGVYHSHPDCPARPSPTDLAAAWEGFLYPIVSVCDGKAREVLCWALNSQGDRFQPVAVS